MAQVTRFDIGALQSPKRTPQGFLRVDGYLTRTGVFEYKNDDGSVRRELRTDDEVNASLESFAMAPVTDEHPSSMVSADNVKEFARGHVGESVRRDGTFVRAPMLITDSALIAKMQSGAQQQVSCGYTCNLDETPGTYQGVKYDAIQRQIVGNHVAIVPHGRAGAGCSVRMDAGALVEPAAATPAHETATSKRKDKRMQIEGIEYEIAEPAAQAVTKALTGAKAEAEKQRARGDVAEAELGKERAARKDEGDKFPARVAARVALERQAGAVLGEAKLDAMSDRQVKCAVVAKLAPEMKLDAATDDYVNAAYDLSVANASGNALASLRVTADAAARTGTTSPLEKARADAKERAQNAWKQPITGALTREGSA